MLLNARKIDTTRQILLAIEDITYIRMVETKLADYTKALEGGGVVNKAELMFRIDELNKLNKVFIEREHRMIELKEEIKELKKEKDA